MALGLLHAYPPQVYGYDDLQMLQTKLPLDYYSIPFPTPTTLLTGGHGSLASNAYFGDLTKFGLGDASSPAPATILAQPQQNQMQTHHTTQQTFLNPALPSGYSYTSLPYYTGVLGLPSTLQYEPAVFPVASIFSKQHGVNVSVNASAPLFNSRVDMGLMDTTLVFQSPPVTWACQQLHSQILHHHLQQDGQMGSGQGSQMSSILQKPQADKSAYNSYSWGGKLRP
ncbi:Ubiquitin-associated protein 2-like [Saguinus oedipus]|uniref:Ubiquitin-associated protein 2-like n=1 Tax=Saguinus oedipus TaxID=9490 RepID=A0ABQ9U1U1_SAGOE|nr:Ubiquitin-associated protein 2-like [Saguinus oedipus]